MVRSTRVETEDQSSPADEGGNQKEGARLVRSRKTEPKREWARSPGSPVGKVSEDETKEGVGHKKSR